MKAYTQQQIINGCLRKDPAFQKALVVQYSDRLMAVSLRYTRDPAMAKDILQDSLVKILKSMHTYKEKGLFEGWMKRIVINTALKYMDKSSFKKELYTIDNVPESANDPTIYAHLAAGELLDIINSIPKTYATVFNLHAIEGYSHREISEMLGIEESTSRSQLTRARTMLKKILLKNDKIRLRI
ncbi:MAG: RNA polymerase sigma factor [Saprospiraceae bacterium]